MAAINDVNGVPVGFDGPATKLVAITKSDATDLTSSKLRALWVGGAGDVTVIALNDGTTPQTLTAVLAGTLLPIAVVKVMAATTATNIIGLA